MASFCTKCGSELKIDGNFCGGCGAAVSPGSASVQSGLHHQHQISTGWQRAFDLIVRSGGREAGWSFPYFSYGKLAWFERIRLSSAWALIFGPFYYLAKGMWRQAISYTAVFTAVTLAITYACGIAGIRGTPNTNLMEAIAFDVFLQQRAKFDYYRKCVLGYNGWW
jgi:hypothetical protein